MMQNDATKKANIYLYGMTVLSNIHLLEGMYPESDSYGEIAETHVVVGGETGNSAIILSNLGQAVSIDGPFLGTKTKDAVVEFLGRFSIDCSKLYYDINFEGIQDVVLIDNKTRTVFGKFAKFFNCGVRRWNKPDKDSINSSDIVSLDPFFGEESEMVARYCAQTGKQYVTIDCNPESDIHKYSAATIISNEYIKNNFDGLSVKALMDKYTSASEGLVIFTFGSKEIHFARKGNTINVIPPYKVDVISTLGAGDTFRAGVVYGILKGFTDEDTVKFAAATAASVCSAKFPMAFNPPCLEDILGLVNGGK